LTQHKPARRKKVARREPGFSGETIPSPETFKKVIQYNKVVLYEYIGALEKLPWKTVSQNMEASHSSMKDTVVHIITVYNGWLNYIARGRASEIPYDTGNPERYRSMKDVRAFADKVWAGVDSLVLGLDEADLRRRVKAPWFAVSNTLADALMQVTLEQAHHTGEIIALLWQLNIEPPEMTWIMKTRG